MSISNLLSDRCDIYHPVSTLEASGTYGVPTEDFQKQHSYPDVPDETDVPCYLPEDNQSVVQSEPNRVITDIRKGFFEPDVDIRINDKIVFDGHTYIAQKPYRVKDSHIKVKVGRVDNL